MARSALQHLMPTLRQCRKILRDSHRAEEARRQALQEKLAKQKADIESLPFFMRKATEHLNRRYRDDQWRAIR